LKAFSKHSVTSILKLLWIKIKFLISLFLFVIGSQLLTIFTFIPLPFNKQTKKRFRENILMRFAGFINLISLNIKIKKYNTCNEKFKTPSIIISNHVSMIDISLILSLVPHLVIITNPRMKHSRFDWILRKYSNLHLISEDMAASIEFLKEKIRNGYSILIFPEGVRSPFMIKRFHKGAFMLAEKFNVDILPIFIKAEGDFLYKDNFFKNKGKIDLHILNRITPDNKVFGNNYEERTKSVCQYYRKLNSDILDKILVTNNLTNT
jgi:uncharacterized protein